MRAKTAADRIACRRVPDGAQAQAFDDVQAVAYTYELAGRACVLAYAGTAMKPAINCWFQGGAEQRERRIRNWVEGLRARKAAKATRAAERKALVHTLKVGDIVYACWGYEQTNVDFFQVVRVVSACSVAIRAIKSEIKPEGPLAMAGYSKPCPNQFEEESVELVRRAEGCAVRNARFKHPASLWTGKPVRCSWYA